MPSNVDVTAIEFSEPTPGESVYSAAEVAATLEEVQKLLDHTADEKQAADEQIANLKYQLEVAGQSGTPASNEDNDTRIEQLEAANAQLRESLKEALERPAPEPVTVAPERSEAEEASEILRRATELADQHVAQAKAEADEIVKGAGVRIQQEQEALNEVLRLKEEAINQMSELLTAHLENFNSYRTQ